MTGALRQQDEATRHLSAAVHLDPYLADIFIDEYLSEPKRAVPPCPGLQAEVVLREAVTARVQRRNLNVWVVVATTLMAVIATPFVIGWVLSAACWRLSSNIVVRLGSPSVNSAPRPLDARPSWWMTAVLWSMMSIVWSWPLAGALVLLALGSDTALVVSLGVGICLSLAIYVLLVAERTLPWRTVLENFSFGSYDPGVSNREQVLRACDGYEPRLQRIAAEDARRTVSSPGEVVVYRGEAPFVGAGSRVRSWSAAFPLRPKQQDGKRGAPVPEFSPSELQDYVAAKIVDLAKADYLTPGSRFKEISDTRWAMISAAQLPYQPRAELMLRQLDSGLDPELSEEDWRELADCSPEWLRYYRCFRVEGWGRQLGVSGYLHVGCVERLMVLEWHGFLLAPIAGEFRRVDHPPTNIEATAMWQSLSALAMLPMSLPSRVVQAARSMVRSAGSDGTWSSPTQAAIVFGARASMRELAAGARLNSFFQESDGGRYLKILERCALDAIAQFMDERGISAKGFDEMVTQINNSTVVTNSQVIAGNIGGSGNTGALESSGPGSSENSAD